MDRTVRRLIVILFLFCTNGYAQHQNTYHIIIKSADGQSNVIGASVYKPYFSSEVPSNAFYLETSLPLSENTKRLNEDVLGPIIGSPSDGDKVYLKLSKQGNKALELLDDESQSFAAITDNKNFFYLLVNAETSEKAENKLIYETIRDLVGGN